jgi:DNA-binding NarL/FixJ family response regulator
MKKDTDVFEVEVGGEKLVVVSVPAADDELQDLLTPAEHEVARDAANGLSNAAIARRRGRKERTIANQLASIYKKLGVGSRAELAVLFARRV